MRNLCLGLSLVIAAKFAGSAHPAQASIVLDIAGGSALPAFSGSDGTAGWLFTVHASITVEGLGFWDEGANGLNTPHEVGIWTQSGALLASATVNNSGTAVPSSSGLGQWLFAKVSPLFLTQGEYVLGAYYANQDVDLARFLAVADTIPQISFNTARVVQPSNGQLMFPSSTNSAQNDAVFGPNLFIASATTPGPVAEPAAVVVWSLGAVAALALSIRRRRASRRPRAADCPAARSA